MKHNIGFPAKDVYEKLVPAGAPSRQFHFNRRIYNIVFQGRAFSMAAPTPWNSLTHVIRNAQCDYKHIIHSSPLIRYKYTCSVISAPSTRGATHYVRTIADSAQNLK